MNKPKKLKDLNAEIVTLKNGKRIKLEYKQNIDKFNRCFVLHKISATTMDEQENKEIGYLKIAYIDKKQYKEVLSGSFSSLFYSAMYGNLSSYDFFDDNGNKKNINLRKETVKSISWNVLSDNNYNKANQHASRIEKMTKYIEFKDYLKEIKPEIDESIKCLKEKNEKLLVDKPYVDFINISEHIGGYKHQGLAIEMYTRAAQWDLIK